MSWSEIWKIAVSIVGALGGAGVIAAALIKYVSNIVADRLSKKYETKLAKDFEKYKSSIENKTYISKTKFDTEFSIFRSLSADYSDAVKAINILIPTGFVYEPADKEAKKQLDEKRFQDAGKAVAKAQDTLKANIPFIPENIYTAYNELLRLSYVQLMAYERRFDVNDPRPQSEKETFTLKDYEKTEELNNKWNALNNMIRDYLNSLEVLP